MLQYTLSYKYKLINLYKPMEIQEVFSRMHDKNKELRELKKIYKDTLASNSNYQELLEKLKEIKEQKKRTETIVSNELATEVEKIETLKRGIADDKQLLSDMSWNSIVKGESISVVGPDEHPYDPIFAVRFQKRK